ncbi:MAG: sugar kinase [Lachnospiraceae bacterium]|jgi:sugar/nucleoside kinase (ribokinase family)|nr:sugar kinase [Lachnospiraceae bacterium]
MEDNVKDATLNPVEVVVIGGAHTDLQLFTVGDDILSGPTYKVQEMLLAVGGDAIDEATVLTRLGHKVRLVSCIGDDLIGSLVLKHCKDNHIDTSYIKVDPAKVTSINVGLIQADGERTFVNNLSGSLWTFSNSDLPQDAADAGKILSFASFFNNPLLEAQGMIPFFDRAKERGMTICADLVTPKKGETLADIREALSYVDYFFPNYPEGANLTGEKTPEGIADALLACGVKNVVLKLGKEGCLFKNTAESFRTPAYPHTKCIDTTGAGDSFASGFICGLLEGWDLRTCAAYANCTASLAVETIGATTGVVSREAVDERYRAYVGAVRSA